MDSRTEKTIIRELRNENLVVFAGAGLSRSSGFVDWKELLKDIADELDLKIDQEHDLVALAQYHYNQNGRETINEVIVQEFQRTARKNENMNILSRLPINTFWTTNYDSIIEDTLSGNGRIVDVKIKYNQLKNYKPDRNAVVYKMHGDREFPQEAILTRDDYENYNTDRAVFTTQLKGELVSKTFLFIGFSFEDPNLEQILRQVRIDLLGESPKSHYCFFRKVNLNDSKYKNDDASTNDEAFRYDEVKQNLKIEDLKRYGIRSILVDEYSDITSILSSVEKKFRVNKLFISGSAEEYGEWDSNSAQLLLHNLSKCLVEENYHIVSGFGLGVGSFVINGALDEIYKSNNKKTNEYLTLRPFPQVGKEKDQLSKLWTKYREDMILDSGVAIFAFGNKAKDGDIVSANGMMEEYEIARKQGKFIIPLGTTGYVAKDILEILIEEDKCWYLKDSIDVLMHSKDEVELIQEILKILDRITNSKAGKI